MERGAFLCRDATCTSSHSLSWTRLAYSPLLPFFLLAFCLYMRAAVWWTFALATSTCAVLPNVAAGPATLVHSRVPFPNTTYPWTPHTHVRLGFSRANESTMQDVPDCDTVAAWTEGWDDRHGCADLFQARVCRGAATAEVVPTRVPVAICVPPIHGELNAEWFKAWGSWHHALGVSHVFVYSGGGVAPIQLPGMSVDWIDLPWLAAYDTWSRAQLWAMHDCMFRARALEHRWVLFLDLDELVRLPPEKTIPVLLDHLEAQGLSGASFGSVPYLHNACRDAAHGDPAQRIAYRTSTPECQPWEGHSDPNPLTCPGWQGRRKYAIRAEGATHKLQIHFPILAEERFVNLPADTVWLKHVRGAPWGKKATCTGGGCEAVVDGSIRCPDLDIAWLGPWAQGTNLTWVLD